MTALGFAGAKFLIAALDVELVLGLLTAKVSAHITAFVVPRNEK